MKENELNNIDVFEKEFIKRVDVCKVTESFEKVKSFDELKENRIFRNLFKNIAEDIDIENEIDNCGEEFITDYSRDILLMAKWFEHLETEGKSINQVESRIDKLAEFYIYLLRYVGEYLHDLSDGIREVFEVWIIKAGITPTQIKQYWKVLNEFYKFLQEKNVESIKVMLLDEEEMKDLQRVADEFKKGIWGKNNEDYSDWRERNILYYM
ncbi:MAG: hypothetical protein ABH879_04655 [archaeon]